MRPHRRRLLAATLVLALTALGASVWAAGLATGTKVYPKRDGALVRADKSSTASVTGKLAWGTAYPVITVDGRWALLSVGKTQGWIYAGNVSLDKPPDVNRNDLMSTQASEVSASAAARGLDKTTSDYAGRHNIGSAAADVAWMEQFNDGITIDQVRVYMQANHLGEYGGQ